MQLSKSQIYINNYKAYFKKRERFVMKKSLILFLIFVIFFNIPISSVKAIETKLDEKSLMEPLLKDLENYLIDNYKNYYQLDNFNFKVTNSSNQNKFLTVMAKFDMTLIKRPNELPFLKGISDTNLASYDRNRVKNDYYKKLFNDIKNEYYMKPEETTITFVMERNKDKKLNNLKVLDFKEILPLNSLKIDSDELYIEGKSAIQDINENFIKSNNIKPESIYVWSYNRTKAKQYALDHAYDPPQYSSDCANFVSQCLNYGGIPSKQSWRPGANNWIRTGYNNNGGVVPYMTNKGYFYKEPYRSRVCIASIIYWNNKSHVGLITYSDTVTLKYSAHTDPRRNELLPSSANVSFYVPSSDIIYYPHN